MILLRHWKMILGLMAIFVAGVGTGGVGVIVLLQRVFTTPVSSQRWADDRVAYLEKKLKLTPDQESKLRPMLKAAADRFQSIGGETFEKIIATAEQTHADMAKELTPEQQVEFNKLRKKVIASQRDLSQREISVRGSGKRGAAPVRPAPEIPAKLDQ